MRWEIVATLTSVAALLISLISMSQTAEDIIRVDTLQKNFLISMRGQLLKELREQLAQELDDAVIELAGNSAATMRQAARIVRGTRG